MTALYAEWLLQVIIHEIEEIDTDITTNKILMSGADDEEAEFFAQAITELTAYKDKLIKLKDKIEGGVFND